MELNVLAQIITGMATLIVAIVLVFQLRKQNQQLAIQHKDFTQQIKNQIMDRRTSTMISNHSNDKLKKIMDIGRYDYSKLKDRMDKTFFHQMIVTTLELLLLKNNYSEETGYEKTLHLKELLGSSPGTRQAYRNSTIRQQLDNEAVLILDEIVKEIDEEVGLDGKLVIESTYPYKK
ncbi:MAG: hypothetical protein CL773_05100 [Chloroflexi bacterium]|nr:hypothetical protein [Chloroflexota bacterium]|tara:strand:+ start:40 stop:567 length:528 start_codon:yes stop_codon:yes gene_type:complete